MGSAASFAERSTSVRWLGAGMAVEVGLQMSTGLAVVGGGSKTIGPPAAEPQMGADRSRSAAVRRAETTLHGWRAAR